MIKSAGFTCEGGRPYNEDSIKIWCDKNRLCAVVADGLGGHGGGDVASRTAAERITGNFSKRKKAVDPEWIRSVFEQANQEVLEKQKQFEMKTTCVSLFLENGQAQWAHLGDSRLYHFVNGRIASFTKDHSVSQLAVLTGEITQEQIRFHEDRNRVLRALGADTEVKIDLGKVRIDDGNFHSFLLCTDGFWEYVLEMEMEIDLSKVKTSQPDLWIQYMVERLKAKVQKKMIQDKKEKPDNDNYSAVAIFTGGPL